MLPSHFRNIPLLPPRRGHPLHITLAIVIVSLVFIPSVVLAQGPPDDIPLDPFCLAVADERDLPEGGEDMQDTLTIIDRTTAESFIIGPTGTENIEAMTFGPLLRLFAENDGYLGTLDPTSGAFTPFPQPLGTGGGIFGERVFGDLDGLAYSLDRDIIFGARRRNGVALDLLFAIDPNTGMHIPDYFGPDGSKTDYVPVASVVDGNNNVLADVDDMQFDPVSGVLYAAMNTDGEGGNLVTIDVNTGATTLVTPFTFAEGGGIIDDIEGLSFYNDGTMYGTTGDNFVNAPENRNRLFRIDPTTGAGTLVGPFPTGPKDFEALACLTADAAIVLKKYTNGPGQPPDDADLPTGPMIEAGATVTWTYIFTNTGVLTLTGLSLVDDQLGVIAPNGISNCFTADTILGPGQSLTCIATGIAITGQYANIGTVTGQTVPGLPPATVSDTNPSHYFGMLPAIEIKKYTNGEDADTPTGPNVVVGSTVTWTYIVRNTGNMVLSNVLVTDDHLDVTPVYVSGDTNNDTLLDLDEVWLYQATGIAVEGQYANTGTVIGTPPVGPNVTDDDPSHYFGRVELLGALGDRVWYDTNKNGLQDNGEAGVPDVQVDLYAEGGTLLNSMTTDSDGNYLFTGLLAGEYYVEFATPQGYSFTHYNVNGNSQDAADSDPVVPTVAVSISDGGETAVVGEVFTYTLFYTNTDSALPAVDVLISTTIPVATSFVVTNSSAGWNCASEAAGSVCTANLGTVNANTSGALTFVVLLDDDETVVPGELVLLVGATQATVGRTAVVALGAGETDLTVDAGVVLIEAGLRSETSTGPTNLPPSEQPGAELDLFLPSVRTEE